MTPTENASEASEKRALWRVERHARWGKCKMSIGGQTSH